MRSSVSEYIDSSGNIVAHYEYSPFGKLTASDGTMVGEFKHRFSGKFFDTEAKLYYYGKRYYSPVLGRWLGRDPIGEEAGKNLYNYALSRPTNAIDPLGLWTVTWDWKEDSHPRGGGGFPWIIPPKWASCEGIDPTTGDPIPKIPYTGWNKGFTSTRFASKGRLGPTGTFTRRTVNVGLYSEARGDDFIAAKGAGYYLQWSGENVYEVTIERDEGDACCAEVEIDVNMSTRANPSVFTKRAMPHGEGTWEVEDEHIVDQVGIGHQFATKYFKGLLVIRI